MTRSATARRRTERPTLSLVFPARDEEANIGPLLDAALALGPTLAREVEIVVVDDGSRDGTASAALARGAGAVRLVRHATSRGYGAALRSGLRAARGELLFFSDADLQFDLRELASLLPHAATSDVVAGYRAPRRDPAGRRVLAGAWSLVVRALFGLRSRDVNCAFKLFRREVIESMAIASDGAFVNTEILVRARRAGFRIREVPVTHRPRRFGRQSGARPRVLLGAVRELVALYGELRGATPPPAVPAPPEPARARVR